MAAIRMHRVLILDLTGSQNVLIPQLLTGGEQRIRLEKYVLLIARTFVPM
jgi:hypothetical protein